jgi:N-acylneuraminate cytidylyltransferase
MKVNGGDLAMDDGKRNVIAIIPARGGSKGIPGTNIMDFCGRPLVCWSIQQALESLCMDDVYVSSDDEEILRISISSGAKPIRRPRELSTDEASSESALSHALDEIEKFRRVELVVFLQATSPLRLPGDIDKAYEKLLEEDADSLFSASILDDFCVWDKDGENLSSLTFDYNNRGRRQDRKPRYLENGSIYIFKPEILRTNKNRLGGKIVMHTMHPWQSFEIDSMEDMAIVAFYMQNRVQSGGRVYPRMEDVRLIVYDFDGVLTDNKVIVSEDGVESVVANRADGLAIGILKDRGIAQVIISKERNNVVEARAKKLGIDVIKGVDDKHSVLAQYCRERDIPLEKTLYVGNDINDEDAMRSVGYPVCPSDAADEIKAISALVLQTSGGDGVVRELLKYIGDNIPCRD